MKRLPYTVGALLIFTLYLLLTAASVAGRAAEPPQKPTLPESPPTPTFSLVMTTTTSTTPTTTITTTRPTTRKATTTRAVKRKDGMRYLGYYYITGYDACIECCGKDDGITKSGAHVTANRTIAMKSIAFGTRIYIDGLGEYVVEDRGVGAGVIDVYCPTHADCYAITGHYDVYIIE